MTILYFAHARRAAGLDKEQISTERALSADELWDVLVARHPELAVLRTSSRLARDNEFLPPGAVLGPTDEVAVIPPVSGG